MKFQPHICYPKDSPYYNDLMAAKEVTFDSMRHACYIIYEKVFLHKWTKEAATKFAQVECIKGDVMEDIYQYAKELRPKRKKDVTDETFVPHMPKHLLPQCLLQNCIELRDCLVGVMHTLFLNVGGHITENIVGILSSRSQWEPFCEFSADVLTIVQSMSLNWCKAFPYSSSKKPASAWVLENFLAFGILSKIISTFFPL